MLVLAAALLLAVSDPAAALASALALEQRGDDAAAVSALDKWVRDEPSAPLPRLELARLLLKSGKRLDEAQAHLEAARALAPENPRAHYLWGLLAQERGQPDEAVRSFERALGYRADYLEAMSRLAGLRFARGEPAQAEPLYRALTRAAPADVAAGLQLAACLERLGRSAEAEAELKRLVKENPRHLAVAARLADLYARTDRPRLAEKVRKAAGLNNARKLRELPRSRR